MRKLAIIILLAITATIAVFQVGRLVFANQPLVNSVTAWIRQSDNHTILNISITHLGYFPGHYVNWVQVNASGTITGINITATSPADQTASQDFVVPYDAGIVTGTPTFRAQAHCTLHGPSPWSAPVQVPERGRGLFNPNAVFLADVNLLFQIATFFVLIISMAFKFRRSYMKHGAIMAIALVLHSISILVVMVPSLADGVRVGLFDNLLTRLPLVVFSHAILGSLVEILGIFLVGAWVLSHATVSTCFKNRRIMRVTILLWLVELIVGVYVYTLLYVPT